MSLAKHELEKYDLYRDTAHNILLEIGAIEVCPHERPIIIKMEGEKVYAIATDVLKKKYPDLNDYKLFHEQIKDVLNDAELGTCVACDKLEND